MKILELCLSHGVGGLEMYVDKVFKGLSDRGFSCQAVIQPGTFLESRFQSQGLPYTAFRKPNKILPYRAARKLARLLDKEQIDILHMHWGDDLLLAVLAKRFAKRNVKLIYLRQMAITRPKRDPFHTFLYRHVDKYVAITKALQTDARRFLPMPPEDIPLLYYGVPTSEPISPAQREAFMKEAGLDEDAFKIALFGRIQHIKGQHVLIDALKQLKQDGTKIQAALIGKIMDQTYFDDLMNQCRQEGLGESVRYLGFIDNPPAHMNCFDLVVLTTYGETFGLVIAEAMRAGVPVAGTNAGGVPEMIKDHDTGLLFEPGDSDQLAEVIRNSIQDEQKRNRMAIAAKTFADTTFSEVQHFEGLSNIFNSVI